MNIELIYYGSAHAFYNRGERYWMLMLIASGEIIIRTSLSSATATVKTYTCIKDFLNEWQPADQEGAKWQMLRL
jgi:hypothetical protein